MISIVDYGLGNLRSLECAFDFLGHRTRRVSRPNEIVQSRALILPGVGAYSTAMKNIDRLGLRAALDEAVLGKGIPVLGICLGMQLLSEEGEEGGKTLGLGWIAGRTIRMKTGDVGLKLPHIGFNIARRAASGGGLFANLPDSADFYFVHSFHLVPSRSEDVASITAHGIEFVSGVARANIFGTQFHPERSQSNGLILLKNFAREAGL